MGETPFFPSLWVRDHYPSRHLLADIAYGRNRLGPEYISAPVGTGSIQRKAWHTTNRILAYQ